MFLVHPDRRISLSHVDHLPGRRVFIFMLETNPGRKKVLAPGKVMIVLDVGKAVGVI